MYLLHRLQPSDVFASVQKDPETGKLTGVISIAYWDDASRGYLYLTKEAAESLVEQLQGALRSLQEEDLRECPAIT